MDVANTGDSVIGGISVTQAIALGYLTEDGEVPEGGGEDEEGGA